MPELSATAKVILGMLKLGARTGYDVKAMTDVSTRFFWGASYGQIYPELRRLERAGMVASDAPTGGRRRRAFRLTRAGERRLHEWMTSGDRLDFEYRDEGLLKFFFGDAVEEEDVLANVQQLRRDFEERLAHFRAIGAEGASGYPAAALDYGIAFLEFNVHWWSSVEQRLSRARRRRPQPAETRAQGRR